MCSTMSPFSFAISQWHHWVKSFALLALLTPAVGDSSSCSWTKLVEVTTSLGAFVADGLILKDGGPERRGLWTTVPLKAGDEIMKIPRKLMIGEAQGAKLAKDAGVDLDDAPSTSAAALFSLASAVRFLEQQGSGGDSAGARLAKVWYSCLQDASVEWSAAYFSTLQHEASSVSVHSQDISAAAWAVEELQTQGVNKDRAQLAVHLALSRGNSAQTGSGRTISVMSPLMDFINHDTNPNTHVDFSQSYCSVTAEHDISVGEELTHRYRMGGSKIAWIYRYGFVPAYKVPDAVLHLDETFESFVRKGLQSFECPEWLISEGLVLLSSTDVMGLGELQLDCLELRRHLKLGVEISAARDTITNPSRVRQADERMAGICSSFAHKYHTRKSLTALGKLRGKASKSSKGAPQHELAQVLLAEVDAIGLCASSTYAESSVDRPREEL